MKSEPLKIGKLYELKILKAGGEFSQPSNGHGVFVWDNRPDVKNSTKIGDYIFNSGPFLVLGRYGDNDYQILAPNEKLGWVYFRSYLDDSQFYFIELVERKPAE